MSKINANIRALKLLHTFSPGYFPIMILSAFFNRLSPYYNMYLSAEIIDEIIGEMNADKLVYLVLITVIGNCLITILSGLLNRLFEHCEIKLKQNEQLCYLEKALSLDYEKVEEPEIRQLRRKIVEASKINSQGRQMLIININWLTNAVVDVIMSTLLCAEMFITVFKAGFSWVPYIYVVTTIFLICLNIRYSFQRSARMAKFTKEMSQEIVDKNRVDDAIDCYNMGKDIRIYRQDNLIERIQKQYFNFFKKANCEKAIREFVNGIPILILEIFLRIITYVFICYYAMQKVFGIGSIVKYADLSQKMIGAVIRLFDIWANIDNNTEFIENYLAYFDIPQASRQGTLLIDKNVFYSERCDEYIIEFRDVSFKYPASEKYALKNVSVKFKVGDKIAVVGVNGSGKTTFIKLLCRLYDPTEGGIYLNGIDIRQYKYEDYMSIFAVVFQDFKLFSFSLAENIAVGDEYDEALIKKCLLDVGFDDRLLEMPDGINTILYKDFEKNGVEISGGEAQKIALARALYRNAPIIVLDEPTAALDPIAEYEIYSKFNYIAEKKTAIYISHRLSSCRFCNSILVFDDGKIIQHGAHEQLLKIHEGKYFELWNAQAQYYKQ